MSQAEELLNNLYDDEIAAYSVDPDSEPHIVVNPDRTITVPEELTHIAVQFDHNVETVTFDCPRYWDEHDFSSMHVYINYMRPDGYKDQYTVKNLRVNEEDDSLINFDWVISENVTLVKGNVSFLVCIKASETDAQTHWNSRLNQSLIIDEGMECSEAVVERNPDLIEMILNRMSDIERNQVSDEAISDAVADYLDKNPVAPGGSVQSDFAQNDESAADYVKNRTHYIRAEGWEISWDGDTSIDDSPITFGMQGDVPTMYYRVSDSTPANEDIQQCIMSMALFENGEQVSEMTANISEDWDRGIELGYITDRYTFLEMAIIAREENCVFQGVLIPRPGTYFLHMDAGDGQSVRTTSLSKPYDVEKLDPIYLPDTLIGKPGTGEYAETFNDPANYASGSYSHAEGNDTYAEGNCSHAEGKDTYTDGEAAHSEGFGTGAVGLHSHAEGQNSESIGEASHAEGRDTYAKGDYSHSEGVGNTASGDASHAEGRATYAILNSSHAEGEETIAYGAYSHAEGDGYIHYYQLSGEGDSTIYTVATKLYTKELLEYYAVYATEESGIVVSRVIAVDVNANTIQLQQSLSSEALTNEGVYFYTSVAYGDVSHIEGWKTRAIGKASHAEGHNTVAAAPYQHVQGKYNIEDTEWKYAHIVGNGSGSLNDPDTFYSNAHTLDWDGNAWYAGTVEATAIILKSSTEGSNKRFKVTVDDNGVLSASEIV